MFISVLYMFRATMCPSSGDNSCINATPGMALIELLSPDDGHIVARNM
jgi:hypothetical protein